MAAADASHDKATSRVVRKRVDRDASRSTIIVVLLKWETALESARTSRDRARYGRG
jgi:hypothetical protein